MLEFEIGLVDGSKLIFNEFFLQFNVKKKMHENSYFKRTF